MNWKDYILSLSTQDKEHILMVILQEINPDEIDSSIGFDPDDRGLFWREDGESLLERKECVYGFCPHCDAPGELRERRPNGNDKCSNGHTYPSKEAVYR